MRYKDFFKLSPKQRAALVIAMHVRNEMEKFHGQMPDGSKGFITDKQMMILNQTIRRSIFEAITIMNKIATTKKEKTRREWEKECMWLIMCIPEYWEIPTEKEYFAKRKQYKNKFQHPSSVGAKFKSHFY